MPEKIDLKVELVVFGFSEAGMTQRSVVGHLKKGGIVVSKTFVDNELKNTKNRRKAKSIGFP